MQVELIKQPEEITSESLKQYLADVSSVVRNAQPKDNDRLFNRLLKESFGGKASRVFEFIPCKLPSNEYQGIIDGKPQRFGFYKGNDWEDNEYYYTNARELLNWGWTWEEIVPTVDFTYYKAVKCIAPYFIYGQVSTHNQITSVSHSARYTESTLGYWKPDEVSINQDFWNSLVKDDLSPRLLEQLMKESGVTRREVFARGSDMLQYRVFSLGGYTNNPNAWEHFINQRLYDSHTQKETRDLTDKIATVIYQTDL